MIKKEYLAKWANVYIAVLLAVQPILDVISFWFDKLDYPGSITLLIRLAVVAVSVVYGFIISERKGIYYVAVGVIALLYACHFFAISRAGIADITADISNYVRVVQTPLFAICMISCVRSNERGFEGIQIGMASALAIMIAVMIISTITGTDPHTYDDGSGILGWFYNTNSQSSNLCVLLPVALTWLLGLKKRNPVMIFIAAALGLLAMYFICTRLAYLGIMATCVGIGCVIFMVRRSDWKYGVLLLAFAVLFAALIPVSSMTKHLNIHNSIQDDRQEWLNDKIEDIDKVKELLGKDKDGSKDVSELSEEEKKELIEQLAPVYEIYIPDFVEIFGLEKTMELYNYTTDINEFAALRAKKLKFAEMLMKSSPESSRVFGLEISKFNVNGNIYDVENDFHGIYYLYGWAGLAAYIAFLAYFVYLIAWALIKDIKKYFTLEAASFGIGFLMCIIHSYLTAGVLRRPNASIYLSALLAAIYFLVKIKNYDSCDKNAIKKEM